MLVTELGIVMEASDLQPANVLLPMIVTEFGMVTEVRDLQFYNKLPD